MKSSFTFSGKNILVTGATSGLGLDLATRLSELKACIFITGRNKDKLISLKELFSRENPNFKANIPADLTSMSDIQYLADCVEILDGLVLNAGVIDYTPAKMINFDKIRQIFQVNFEANVLLIQGLLKRKKISKGASVVFISSIAPLVSVKGTSLYAASKAALNSYAKVLALELAGQKIRVNVISPGIIETDLIRRENVATSDQFIEQERQYPFGFGKPEDVSNAALFLLSEASKWITGTNMVIDGGHLLQ